MCRWDIIRRPSGIDLIFTNPATGDKFDCGVQRPDTPIQLLLDWVEVEADPGDAAFVDGELVFLKGDAEPNYSHAIGGRGPFSTAAEAQA
jgi:hypothetical protein